MPLAALAFAILMALQDGAASLHVPARHSWVAPHTFPHMPQFLPSTASSASQPVATSLSQSSNPMSHAAIAHVLIAHVPLPCAGLAHFLAHAPQLSGSVAR